MECGYKNKTSIESPASNNGFVELCCHSNFSFLIGASHPEEFITEAHQHKYAGIGIADLHSLAGVVRAHAQAKELQVPLYVGVTLSLTLQENSANSAALCFLYPRNKSAYALVSRLLSATATHASSYQSISCSGIDERLFFDGVPWKEAFKEAEVLFFPTATPTSFTATESENHFAEQRQIIQKLLSWCAPDALSLVVTPHADDASSYRSARLLHAESGIPLLASQHPFYHHSSRRPLQDIVTCIRHRCTISEAGTRLFPHADRCLRELPEVLRRFRGEPSAIARTVEVASRITFSLDELRYEYPHEVVPAGYTPAEYLAEQVQRGLTEKFGSAIPERVATAVKEELALIAELKFEKYFLTCFDIVRFARSQQILCQGRGAAANSVTCFALGITSVDPTKIDLLFARFISRERGEPPDIDIDFEHQRREEVMQYIYQRYGRERTALVGAVITYRRRSAVRDVGKALGLSPQLIDTLANQIHRWTGYKIDFAALGLDANESLLAKTFELVEELVGFPRHISQHVGGFIISDTPLCDIVPIVPSGMPGRSMVVWDKDDIEVLSMLKIDILALGMLSALQQAIKSIETHTGKPLALHTIPAEDPQVYAALQRADTIGVFQVESRAQMSMLPRLKPACFYDLVIQVAIVRPGPIQGNMVHPFLRRRAGIESIEFPDEAVAQILGKTLGVPIFQEQAMRLAITLAGFSGGEAERLRRAMAAWRRDKGVIAAFSERIVAGMVAKGYSKEFAEVVIKQLRGFSEYGFPESHAASFALLVYASAWIKVHYPAHFAAALINSQPMGFYTPAQIIDDARRHQVTVLPIDIGCSQWESYVEGESQGLRLGFSLIKGISEVEIEVLLAARAVAGSWSAISTVWQTAKAQGLFSRATMKLLAEADAFSSFGLTTRDALWLVAALPHIPSPLDKKFAPDDYQATPLFAYKSLQEAMYDDLLSTGVSLRAHPIGIVRQELAKRNVLSRAQLDEQAAGAFVSVAGLGAIRQRPGTAKGMLFITLEDETGMTNLLIRPAVFEQYQRIILTELSYVAHGTVQRSDGVLYIQVITLESLDQMLGLPAQGKPIEYLSYSY